MKIILKAILSSLLLVLGFTACPTGGGSNPGSGSNPGGTVGQMTATFSNASGTTGISPEPFSSGVTVLNSNHVNTIFAGIQPGRVIEIEFFPPFTASRTCSTDAGLTCAVIVGKTGVGLSFAKNGTITATLSGNTLTITANGTFTQKDGVTFDAQVNATLAYTP